MPTTSHPGVTLRVSRKRLARVATRSCKVFEQALAPRSRGRTFHRPRKRVGPNSIVCGKAQRRTVVVRFGKPYEEIVRHATESQTRLIVMTASRGDAVDRAAFGSTTYRVIQFWGLAQCWLFTLDRNGEGCSVS